MMFFCRKSRLVEKVRQITRQFTIDKFMDFS